MTWLNRPIYSLLLRLATPLLLLRLFWRGRKESLYTQDIGQRLGFYGDLNPVQGAVWLHAVSLGEMRTAGLLLTQWRLQNPDTPLLLTCSTATGYLEGEKFIAAGANAQLIWLPWDMPGAVQRFLRTFKPRIGLLMETEVWPNLSYYCKLSHTPLLLINARLSKKSLDKALRLSRLAIPAYAALEGAWAQSPRDAENLEQLRCKILGISGNIKFDVQIQQQQITQANNLKALWGHPKILALASSREGEEALFLQALNPVDLPEKTVILIVPRHPQRFIEVEELASKAGWRVLKRGDFFNIEKLPAHTLLLGDSMGEMGFYYGLSDVALMGGSYLPFGGQNLIEALAYACPVILGPHTFNFAEASLWAEQARLASRAANMQQAIELALLQLTQNAIPKTAFSDFLEKNQGGIQRTLAGIENYLTEK